MVNEHQALLFSSWKLPAMWKGTFRGRSEEDPQDFWAHSKSQDSGSNRTAGHHGDLDLVTLGGRLSLQCMYTQALHVHSSVVGSQERNTGVLFVQTNGNHGNRVGSDYTNSQKIIVNGKPSSVPAFSLVLVPQGTVLSKALFDTSSSSLVYWKER